MVVFSCNRCSKGLKKKEVEKHSFQCGGINVTCIDCLKDFKGDEYDKHTSCVTEEVRYGGKGVVAKETGKKQNQWLGIVRRVLKGGDSLDSDVRKFLKSIEHFDNIPRNQKKFQNFARSSANCQNVHLADKVFSVLQAECQKNSPTQNKPKTEKPANGNDSSASLNGANEKAESGVGSEHENEPKEGEEDGEKSVVPENGKSPNDQNVKKLSKKERKVLKKKEKVAANKSEEKDDFDVESEPKKEPKKGNEEEEEKPVVAESGKTPNDQKVEKMSKKERKMLKKKAKFAAEMMEVEQYQKEENCSDGEEERTKKSKKRKLEDSEASAANGDDKAHEGKKGSKKRKVDSAVQELNENEAEGQTESPVRESNVETPKPHKQKFNWFDNIVQVLKKSKDGEISVKRLSKKIIDEYVSLYGDHGIHEKLHAKFNKKIKTCPQVKVLKDKVILIDSE